MGIFDPRILKVTFEVDGETRTFTDLKIQASGSKFSNDLQNEFEIKITNLSKDTRDFLLTETNILDRSKTNKKVRLEVGRESYGTALIFEGDIRMTTVSQPPDITVTIKTYTGDTEKDNIVAKSQGSLVTLNTLAKTIAKDLSRQLVFEATDKQIANYSYTGGNLGQVRKLGEVGGVDAYIDDGKLIVKDSGKALSGSTKILNKDSGMVGIPQLTERGLSVKMLFDPSVVIGGDIDLTSTINPATNGSYVIYKMTYDIANRDNSFYITTECNKKVV